MMQFKIDPAWAVLLRELGLKPRAILRRSGLPEDLLFRKGASLSAEDYFRLWDGLEAEASDPLLPLELAQMAQLETFHPPLFAALCSPTFNVAMERLSTYKKLVGPLTLAVDIGEHRTEVTLSCLGRAALPELMGAMEVCFLMSMVRRATHARIQPLEVVFRGSIGAEPEYTEYFGMPVRHGPVFTLTLSGLDARRPFLTENSEMWQVFEPHLRQRLADLEGTASVTEKVHALLLELLPAGRSSTQDVGRKLGMSTRTLQRRLRQEGTSFQEVLASTREQLARHYLAHTDLPGGEISFMLGYDSPSSFYRAFQGWTGSTPERVRARATG